MNDFGRRLKLIREHNGITQSEFAAKSGFQPSAISHFEAGRRSPSMANLRRIAESLNVSLDYLLNHQLPPAPPNKPPFSTNTGDREDREIATLRQQLAAVTAERDKLAARIAEAPVYFMVQRRNDTPELYEQECEGTRFKYTERVRLLAEPE